MRLTFFRYASSSALFRETQTDMSKDKNDPKPQEVPVNLDIDSELPPDADLEERFNDFWKRNGSGIFGGIALGAVIVIGFQLYQYFGNKREEAIRAAYAEATTLEQRLAFAQEHSEHQLASLARLLVADARYQEEAYDEAAQLYGAAVEGFEDPTFATRARLGQGMSLIRSGEMEAGQAVLRAVALDAGALDQTRGEAAYHLAVSFWEAGDAEKALEMTDVILQLDNAAFWAFRANSLRERLGANAAS